MCPIRVELWSLRVIPGIFALLILSAIVFVFFLTPLYAEHEEQYMPNSDLQTLEEMRIVSLLQDKMAELDQREKAVQIREKELKILRNDVEDKLEQIQTVRLSLQEFLVQKQEVQQEKIRELSGIYENMNSASAARALLAMDRELAISILSNMRRKLAGKILDLMPGDEAAAISRDYTNMGGYRPPP